MGKKKLFVIYRSQYCLYFMIFPWFGHIMGNRNGYGVWICKLIKIEIDFISSSVEFQSQFYSQGV